MSAHYSVIISLKTDRGLVVGHGLDVREDRVVFTVPTRLVTGQELEFRLELRGANDTVLGWLRVGPRGLDRSSREELTEGQITRISPDDQATYARWVKDIAVGRVASHLREDRLGRDGFTAMHGATQGETDHALNQIEARKERFAHIRGAPAPETEGIFVKDLFQQAPAAPPAARAPSAPPPVAPPPAAPPAPPTPVASRPAAPAPAHAPTLPPAPARRPALPQQPPPPAVTLTSAPPPQVALLPTAGGELLMVAWLAPDAHTASRARGLDEGWLLLPSASCATWPERPRIHLSTWQGLDLECSARRVGRDGDQVRYRLDLDSAALARLSRGI